MALFRYTRSFRLLFGLYLLLVFSVVIPFHSHSGSIGHHDSCAVCSISQQPFLADTGPSLAITLVILILAGTTGVILQTSCQELPRLRSPPTF
jgi:hypothetical protein